MNPNELREWANKIRAAKSGDAWMAERLETAADVWEQKEVECSNYEVVLGVLEKRLEAAEKWIREKGRHTIYCGWKDNRYQVELGCTCGRDAILEDK